jgi:hypothetical protein
MVNVPLPIAIPRHELRITVRVLPNFCGSRLDEEPPPTCARPEAVTVQRPIIGEAVSPDVPTEQRAVGRPRSFDGLCDEEAVPLICPTCQVSAQSVGAGDRLLHCMGLFSIFLWREPATRRECGTSSLSAHMPAKASQRSGAPDTIRTCDLCLRSNLGCPTQNCDRASNASL